MKRLTKKPWFGPKRLGWGWRPITWEGWISCLILIGIIFELARKKATDPYLVFYVLGIVAVFAIFCYLTGGKPGMEKRDKE